MSARFYDAMCQWSGEEVLERIHNATGEAVLRAVEAAERGNRLTLNDFMALISPAATPFLERMAQAAQAITWRTFGRAVQVFTPLYLANYCTNRCVYCGFNTTNSIKRTMLSMDDVEREGAAIAAKGLRHILLLTGDAPKKTGPDYIAEAARHLRKWFPSISVEVYALTVDEYALLRDAGVDGMTMFQETYNEALYPTLHPAGPKHDFHFRLEAPGRAGEAGLRTLNVGALLGLDVWQRDAFYTGLHADWLQRHYPAAEIAVSVPRMRPHAGAPCTVHDVTDADLVQNIVALRLFLPMTGITVSTRERPGFRDHLLDLGVTKVSAGVSTTVGGHVEDAESQNNEPQFHIADNRSVDEMLEAIRSRGYQPVLKHWEPLEGNAYTCGT